MKPLRPFILLAAFAGLTLPLMPLQQLFLWTSPRLARAFPHRYHRWVSRILGVRVRVEGRAPKAGPLLLASNHVSWLDIVVMSAAAPVSFIAKREVGGWPFFGSLARLQRTVFVDRDKRSGTGGSRDDMQARLKAGDILVLFAEGTSGDGSDVKPFKSAFFAAADLPGVDVQPVTIAYRGHWGLPLSRRRRANYAWYGDMDLAPHLWSALVNGPIEVDVIFHAPLALGEAGGRKALARAAETTVQSALARVIAGKVPPGPEVR